MDQFANENAAPAPPLPVLQGNDKPSGTQEPPVISHARGVNITTILYYGVIFIVATWAMMSGPKEKTDVAAGVGFLAALVGVVAIAISLYIGLKKRRALAWWAQAVFSLLCVFSVPIGTLLHWGILRQWFKPETKQWFGIR